MSDQELSDEYQTTSDEVQKSSIQKPPQSAATSESGFDGHLEDSTNKLNVGHNSKRPPLSPFRTSTATRLVTKASLGPNSQGLVLYELTNEPGKAFSPHCWKTVLDLKLLNIGCTRKRLSFAQIRGELSEKTDDQSATVPVLELSDGTYLKDSWSIALYLHAHHPNGQALFPNSSSKSFAAMLNSYGNTRFAPLVAPLVRPSIYTTLDSESQQYYENIKVGKQLLNQYRNFTADERDAYIQDFIDALEPIEAALAAVASQQLNNGNTDKIFLEAGQEPTHADMIIFGYYCQSRTELKSAKRIWHAHSHISKWIENVTEWAGADLIKDLP